MCSVNKFTGKMESYRGGVNFIVWSWFFLAVCCHAFYSIGSNFRKWLVLQTMGPLFLPSTSRGVLNARVMMNMLAIGSFFS